MTSLNLSHQWLYFTSLHLIIYYYQPEHLISKHYFIKIFLIFLYFMYYIKFSQYFFFLNYYMKLINKIIFLIIFKRHDK